MSSKKEESRRKFIKTAGKKGEKMKRMNGVVLMSAMAMLFVSKLAIAGVILQVESSTGKLLGATGVVVDSVSYDVLFKEGTCNGFFSGCNPTAFDFTTEASARAASQALLDQVFIDGSDGSFDSDSSETFGCSSTECLALTPYSVTVINAFGAVFVASARNYDAGTGTDLVGYGGAINYTTDTASFNNWVWADWSVQRQSVPEPPTFVLLGLGLIGISVIRRRARVQ